MGSDVSKVTLGHYFVIHYLILKILFYRASATSLACLARSSELTRTRSGIEDLSATKSYLLMQTNHSLSTSLGCLLFDLGLVVELCIPFSAQRV
jgi:hypothetical protein